MKCIDRDKMNLKNERILHLLAELNSTLDLYYESAIECEVGKAEKSIH